MCTVLGYVVTLVQSVWIESFIPERGGDRGNEKTLHEMWSENVRDVCALTDEVIMQRTDTFQGEKIYIYFFVHIYFNAL